MDKAKLRVTKDTRNNQKMSNIEFITSFEIGNYDYRVKHNKNIISFSASKIDGSIKNIFK